MKKGNLTQVLDYIHSDTLITLYLSGKIIGTDVPVYAFPSRHDLNEYYGNEVLEIRAIDKDKMTIYIAEKE